MRRCPVQFVRADTWFTVGAGSAMQGETGNCSPCTLGQVENTCHGWHGQVLVWASCSWPECRQQNRTEVLHCSPVPALKAQGLQAAELQTAEQWLWRVQGACAVIKQFACQPFTGCFSFVMSVM
jgi:hypothetical protein